MAESINILLIDDDPAEEIILRALMAKVDNYRVDMTYCTNVGDAVALLGGGSDIDIVLLDNRLAPGEDFRESVPRLRQIGFIGPIGIISSSLVDEYFQSFEEYGADFRIDKSEFDPTVVEFIIREYMSKK